jgi:alcohol dehydrogenase class IV
MIGSPNAPRNLNACKIPIINIPTSLAGGEYTCGAGATNLATLHKGGFYHPSMGADLVILDPALSITTPRQVWISTGIRSIDHCVEALCSTHSTDASDLTAAAGLRLLVNGLLQTNSSWGDMKAREDCMMGVIESAKGLNQNMPMGGSHAIGHQLGPLGMGQGETSCILLPAVTKYNAKHGDTEVLRRQEKVLEILWGEEKVQRLLNSKGFEKGKVDLSSVLAAFIEELGMPQSLKNFGIGHEDLDQLAEGTLLDPWSKTNPVPLLHKEQVLEILEMV